MSNLSFRGVACLNRRTATASLAGLVLLVAGCSQELPPQAQPQRAREALTAALDAWKGGATESSLQARVPAIHVNEPEWRAGARLLSYEIKSEQAAGQSWRCEVDLTLQPLDGPRARQSALYCIDTDPALVVVRE
jgi:hypothetical protein